MSTFLWIILILLALIVGLIGGFFMARKYMEKYLKDNPPINKDQLRVMMLQMGQKPSAKKLNQMMNSMKANAK
ncbi:YneF family protein [Apilactobacillus kunkeei]|uniref:YneF family protein n=1 Tax=Apilactobacillus kunkeei TaxID=148814 RepID=UPI0011288F2C|nr:YneF family protein [Apilactobacillus kunkeei]TPR54628.1 YneF family protein [Apilactobacillus kunkeei]